MNFSQTYGNQIMLKYTVDACSNNLEKSKGLKRCLVMLTYLHKVCTQWFLTVGLPL